MQWEQLTSLDFERTVRTCKGVCIIPIGVIEPHAAHLPLGMDMMESHWTACRAAEAEPAIVFPPYPFGINHESAHLPGSLVVRRELVFALLENICDETARHGLTRIIILSGHGGNRYFIPLFVQTLTEQNKAYTVYYADLRHHDVEGLLETNETGHACEAETSVGRHIHDHLVKMDQVPPAPSTSLKRNHPLAEAGGYSPVDWYAMYPTMYVGDARSATPEKGKIMAEKRVTDLVELIRRVKEDTVTPELQEDFLQRKQKPSSPDSWTQ